MQITKMPAIIEVCVYAYYVILLTRQYLLLNGNTGSFVPWFSDVVPVPIGLAVFSLDCVVVLCTVFQLVCNQDHNYWLLICKNWTVVSVNTSADALATRD